MNPIASFLVALLIGLVNGQWNPHWKSNHSAIVHLFEWKWSDIARECETFLGPNGFGGVQTSPPTENTIIDIKRLNQIRPWWERYQPISYKIETRSGDEAAFADMTRRCNAVGVRIYPDIILNHMSATSGLGTGSSMGKISRAELDFPAVPFTTEHFHTYCKMDWNDPKCIRECWLLDLPDLNQTHQHVRDIQIGMLNRLIDLGVAGFRFDAFKHMKADDLEYILNRMKILNTNYGFAPNSRPFVMGEVLQAHDTI